jgi:LPXTG-site transpeptidase (sortase) family protein
MREDRVIDYGRQARQGYFSSRQNNPIRPPERSAQPPTVTPQQTSLQNGISSFGGSQSAITMAHPIMASSAGVADITVKASLFASFSGALVQFGIPLAAVILIGAGAGLGIASIVNNINVQNQVKHFASSAKDSGQTDSSSGFVASTNPREPVKVEIPDLSISADTTKVDVNNKGNIGSPASIKQLAWYDQSSSPIDSTGTALIVGHVGSPTYAGELANLYKIKNGAQIKVTMGDGAVKFYAVSKIENINVDNVKMVNYLPYQNQTTKQLVLITCTGDYNAQTYSYADRLIVTANALTKS